MLEEDATHHIVEWRMIQKLIASFCDLLGSAFDGAEEAIPEALLAALQAAATRIQHLAERSPGTIQRLQIGRLLLCDSHLPAIKPSSPGEISETNLESQFIWPIMQLQGPPNLCTGFGHGAGGRPDQPLLRKLQCLLAP